MTVTGTLTLANGAQGIYNLNGGTLATGTLVKGASAASLNFGGGTLKATAALSSAVPITLNAGGGTVNTNGNNVSLTGAIGGMGGLTKTGAGSLTLSGGNSYSGLTSVNTGTLNLNSVNTGGGDYATAAGTALNFAASMTVGDIDGAGTTTIQTGVALSTQSVVQDTLQIMAGSSLTILPTAGAETAALLGDDRRDGTATVPEPAAWLLLLSGGAAGLLRLTLRAETPIEYAVGKGRALRRAVPCERRASGWCFSAFWGCGPSLRPPSRPRSARPFMRPTAASSSDPT